MQTNIQAYSIDQYADHDAEREVLKALFNEPEQIYQTDVRTHDFIHPEHRKIYAAMLLCYADGLRIDPKAVHDYDPSIGVSLLFNLAEASFTSANMNYHVRTLREKTYNRKCREVLTKLTASLGDDDFLRQAERGLMEIHESQQASKYIGIPELLSLIRVDIRAARDRAHYGIQTGFTRLNEAIVGMCPRQLWMLGAYTSHGKSTLLSQIVSNICKIGASVIVFSVEDGRKDKLIRLLATETGEPIMQIVRGRADEGKIRLAENEIEQYALEIYDDVYTLEEMDLKIRKHKMQKGVDVVAIDFVQNIRARGESIFDRMSEVAITLQQLAKKHDICVLALSQISEGKDKGSISLRGAQELASAADVVLWIDREADKQEFSLIVRKNRQFGKTGKIPMRFNSTWTNIQEA